MRDRLHDGVGVLDLRGPLHWLDVDDGRDGLGHSLLRHRDDLQPGALGGRQAAIRLPGHLGVHRALAVRDLQVGHEVLPVGESHLAVEAPDDGPGREGVRDLLGFAEAFLVLVTAATEQCRVLEKGFLLLEVFPTTKTEDLLIAGNSEMSSLMFLQRAAVGELSMAELTLVGFLSSVNPLVFLQVREVDKVLPAVVTVVRVGPFVEVYMSSE